MRQRIEIIIGGSVDVDDWIPEQRRNEMRLHSALSDMVKQLTGEEPDVIEIEYGEPV